MGQSIAFTSGKGGTGKTTMTAGLATCLAALGHSVMCVDADVGARNLDISLGMSDALLSSADFSDVLSGTAPLGAASFAHPTLPGLSLMTAPLTRSLSEIHVDRFGYLVRALSRMYDYVLVDGSAGLDENFSMVTAACRRTILVTLTDPSSLRVAARAAGLLEPHKPAELIVNRVIPRLVRGAHATNIDDIIDTVGLPLIGLVPEDEMIPSAAYMEIPLILAGGSGAAGAMLRIARRITGENIPLKRMKQWKVDAT